VSLNFKRDILKSYLFQLLLSHYGNENGATEAFLYSSGRTTGLGTLGGANSSASGINNVSVTPSASVQADHIRHRVLQ
jgi:uncharacterized membrane protein